MLSFYNINSIAKYERRILLRSWFFRIFVILSLLVIGVFSASTVFDKNPFTWSYRSLPSAMFYSNMFLLNIFQSIIAVFLATDFLKRDKKLNTSEVLFIRPMTNTEYIFGKTLGLLTVFIILNLLVIILSSIYLLISNQIPFQIIPILLYFFLISIPTLFFIIGLSYTLMIVIKNQPVAFILLLGYIALILFYLGPKIGYLFDYMVFVMPMAFSDIIGFNNFSQILIHRLSYFILGCAFIVFTVWKLNRIPNRTSSNWSLAIISLLLFCVAAFGFFRLYSQNKMIKSQRAEYARLCSAYFNRPVPEMTNASIKFEYGKTVKAQSEMTLKNLSGQLIDTLFLSINPGFKVEKMFDSETEYVFEQESLLVKVILTSPMKLNQKMKLTMEYSGKPNFDIAYLDNEHEVVYGYERMMSLRIDREYGFYTNNYVLLTKENLWYPIPGIAYDPGSPAIFRQQFTKFDLEVTTKPGLLPVSQGKRSKTDSLIYRFTVRDPLPQLSLTIGKYKERNIDISGIDVRLNYMDGHDYFDEYLSELKDTLGDLIVEFLNDYERPLGSYYPYTEFSLVEVPVQFATQSHSWTSTQANSQPQMVFFPEGGFNVMQADFKSGARRIQKDSERNKEGLEEVEIQAKVFTNFLKSVFTEENSNIRFGSNDLSTKSNPYSIFPNYYYYVNYITSDECPVLNYAFESYLMKGEEDPRQMFMKRITGISDGERANMLLKNKSLKQIIADEDDQIAVNRVLKAKGAYLLLWLEKQINNDKFRQFLLDYLYDNSYREIKYNELASALSQEFNIELNSFISDWYNANKLPSFTFGKFTVVETIEKSQAVYVVKTKVTNISEVAGLVKFTFQLGEGGRRGGPGGFMRGATDEETEDRIYLIDARQTKEFQIVLSESPRSVIYNSLLSENIPSSAMENSLRPEKDDKMKAVEFEKISDKPVVLFGENELILDNKDEGFTVYDPAMKNPLRQFVEKKKKTSDTEFVGEGFGQTPSTWGLSANSDYFGKIEHSAMIVRSGDGNKIATWKKVLPSAGYYDIFVYLNKERRRGRGRNGGGSDPTGKYVYTVIHDDGSEEVELEVKDFEDGWNLLGSFYLSSDTSIVSLSDKGGANKVVADAVKWELQR